MSKYGYDKLVPIKGRNEVIIPLERTLFDPEEAMQRQCRSIQIGACTYGGRHNQHFTTRRIGEYVLVRREK